MVIPLADTPIYAELKAEHEVQTAINEKRTRPIDRHTFTRAPILKNGRKP